MGFAVMDNRYPVAQLGNLIEVVGGKNNRHTFLF